MGNLSPALHILDEVQHLRQLEALEPARFVAALGARERESTSGVLGAIDRFAEKSMRIRLHHLPDALPARLPLLLSSTIVAYERDEALLRTRVAALLERVDRGRAQAMTDAVCAAAARVLAARASLRRGVLAGDRAVAVPRPPSPAAPAPSAVPAAPASEEHEPDPTWKRFSLLELD